MESTQSELLLYGLGFLILVFLVLPIKLIRWALFTIGGTVLRLCLLAGIVASAYWAYRPEFTPEAYVKLLDGTLGRVFEGLTLQAQLFSVAAAATVATVPFLALFDFAMHDMPTEEKVEAVPASEAAPGKTEEEPASQRITSSTQRNEALNEVLDRRQKRMEKISEK